MFKLKKIENKDVYYSDILDDFNVEHFFTSRDLIIRENIGLISKYLKINPDNLISPNQVHKDNIEIVSENKKEYPDCDGLILNSCNKAIYLNFADCTPVILYDYKSNVASIIHAGWRGTALEISKKAVLKMKKEFASEPKNIFAIIGPCISFERFETSPEAIFALKKTISNENGLFKDNFADLKGINKMQLNDVGVNNVDICPYCTVLDNNKFFSYRNENKTKNRHSALVKLNI